METLIQGEKMKAEINQGSRDMRRTALALALAAVLGLPVIASAQLADDNLTEMLDAREIPVTLDTFNRAATDIELDKYV